jgi:flagellar motor switch protein FliM
MAREITGFESEVMERVAREIATKISEAMRELKEIDPDRFRPG